MSHRATTEKAEKVRKNFLKTSPPLTKKSRFLLWRVRVWSPITLNFHTSKKIVYFCIMKKSEQYIKISDNIYEYLIPISNLLSIVKVSTTTILLTYKNTTTGSLKNIPFVFLSIPGYTSVESAKTLVPFSIAKALSTGVEVLETDLVVAAWGINYN